MKEYGAANEWKVHTSYGPLGFRDDLVRPDGSVAATFTWVSEFGRHAQSYADTYNMNDDLREEFVVCPYCVDGCPWCS